MVKVRPWGDQPSDRGWLKNRTDVSLFIPLSPSPAVFIRSVLVNYDICSCSFLLHFPGTLLSKRVYLVVSR